MSTERIIGIDFGTSTSVMRVKRYGDNGQSVDDRLYTAEVKFGNNSLVPTLIRKMPSGEPYYGYDAQKEHKKSTLLDNFKVDLENPDPQKREQARALTREFFAYLAKQYRDQSSGGFFGEADETEKTLVSYPVKWSDETRKFMLEAAKKAGFKNVEGMDEAQAAITAVMVQSADYLAQRGYLRDGVPANILMADMGAGTTDLVLCRYTPGKNATYEILSAWPKDGGTLFGGREVETMLQDYLRSKLPEKDADKVMKRCSLSKFKSWKEDYVSLALSRNETVTEFTEFDERVEDLLEEEIEEYAIDRSEFEKIAADYLKGFPVLVNGCLKDAGLPGDGVDLILLTGGHSQWYFVKEQLCGRLDRFGAIGLGKMKADPDRIIPVPRPQETVALGLVYSPLAREVRFAGREEPKSEPEPAEKAGGEKQTRQAEARVEVKSPQPVHKNEQPSNKESAFWDESKRVLSVTPKEEFEFRKVEGTYAVETKMGFNYKYDIPYGYEVVRYLGHRKVVSIPSQYRGRPVVAVGKSAFDKKIGNALELEHVEIPGSCRVIREHAFQGRDDKAGISLKRVILYPGVQIIGMYAFQKNGQISSLELPDGLLEIGSAAFDKCDIKKIYIPASCRCIWDYAIDRNYNLSEVIFSPDAQIEQIGEKAFFHSKVKRIKLPRSCGCGNLIRKKGEKGKKGKKGTFLGLFDKPDEPDKPDEFITIERY